MGGQVVDVITGQGELSVGRDVDAGMTGAWGGPGMDGLAERRACFWGSGSPG